MDSTTIVIFSLVAVIIIGFLLLVLQRLSHLTKGKESDKGQEVMMKWIQQTQESMEKQQSQSLKVVQDITSKLEQVEATNKRVIDFASQLQSLEDLLKNPKQRGILGEYFLESLLKNVLPPKQYQMQYSFKDGEAVDAVVFLQDKIIPIDSKFSLENYNRIVKEKDQTKKAGLEQEFKNDLKKRIDETSKYIRPNEKTTDYAFMFIPAEQIYYDLLVNEVGAVKINTRNLIEYAFRDKRVIIVSPTTFYAYLRLFVDGMRMQEVAESVQDVIKKIRNLNQHFLSYEEYLKRLGTQLSTVVNTYNQTYKEYAKIDKDVAKLTDREKKIDPELIDKPETEN